MVGVQVCAYYVVVWWGDVGWGLAVPEQDAQHQQAC